MDGIIKVSPEKLEAAATEFSGTASTVSALTNEMTDMVNSLSGAWTGEAATAAVAAMKAFFEKNL